MNGPFVNFTTWSPKEIEIAASMWQRLFADHHGDDEGPKGARERTLTAIAERIQRPYRGVWQRFHDQGPSFHTLRKKASDCLLADRDARKEAENRRSITAEVFGDPPPGFSALDRRKQV